MIGLSGQVIISRGPSVLMSLDSDLIKNGNVKTVTGLVFAVVKSSRAMASTLCAVLGSLECGGVVCERPSSFCSSSNLATAGAPKSPLME
jgi:hypothetical protein